MKKKTMLLGIAIILATILFTMTGCSKKQETQEEKGINTEWGELYYQYIIQNSNNTAVRPEEIENGTLQFIQLKDNDNPIMITSYNDVNRNKAPILQVNYIGTDNMVNNYSKVRTDIQDNNIYDIELLYNIEKQEYRWYIHESYNGFHQYTDIIRSIEISEKTAEHRYDSEYYKSEEYKEFVAEQKYIYDFSERLATGETAISSFSKYFIKVEDAIKSEQVKLESFKDEEKLKEAINNAILGYKTQNEVLEKLDNKPKESEETSEGLQVGNYILKYGLYESVGSFFKDSTIILNKDKTYTYKDNSYSGTGNYKVRYEDINPEGDKAWIVQFEGIGEIAKDIALTDIYVIMENGIITNEQAGITFRNTEKNLEENKLKVGNYTLEYGKYTGQSYDMGTYTMQTFTTTYVLQSDGTYTYSSTSGDSKNGTYKVISLDSMGAYYNGQHGIEFNDGSILAVPSNNTLQVMAGAMEQFTYQGQ